MYRRHATTKAHGAVAACTLDASTRRNVSHSLFSSVSCALCNSLLRCFGCVGAGAIYCTHHTSHTHRATTQSPSVIGSSCAHNYSVTGRRRQRRHSSTRSVARSGAANLNGMFFSAVASCRSAPPLMSRTSIHAIQMRCDAPRPI